jgi:Mg2+-importing ATPase
VLLATTGGVAVAALALPYLPGAHALGFVPLTAPIVASVLVIAAAYVATTELAKAPFFHRPR